MNLILNVIILIFETIYYSLFMKNVKETDSLWKYILSFSIGTILILVFNYNSLMSYLVFVFSSLFVMKYIAKIKIVFYDLFVIILMMIYKLIIESIFVIFIYIFTHNAFIIATILGAIKIIVTLLTKGIINKVYFKLKVYWYQNRFFIRYIFDIIMFVYIIVSCVFLVLNRMGV